MVSLKTVLRSDPVQQGSMVTVRKILGMAGVMSLDHGRYLNDNAACHSLVHIDPDEFRDP